MHTIVLVKPTMQTIADHMVMHVLTPMDVGHAATVHASWMDATADIMFTMAAVRQTATATADRTVHRVIMPMPTTAVTMVHAPIPAIQATPIQEVGVYGHARQAQQERIVISVCQALQIVAPIMAKKYVWI